MGTEKFVDMIVTDLYKSVVANFGELASDESVSNDEQQLHLNSIRQKSAVFVGRKIIKNKLIKYCTYPGGKPGVVNRIKIPMHNIALPILKQLFLSYLLDRVC